MAALAYRDTTAENREFWKNELSSAIREIQQEYDNRLDGMRGELEAFYNVKVQEFKTGTTRQNMELVHAHEEISRLKNQLTDLRPRLNDYETKVIDVRYTRNFPIQNLTHSRNTLYISAPEVFMCS